MTYSNKVKNALFTCKTLEEVEQVEEAVKITTQLNRRTKEGRETTEQLLKLCNQKAQHLIKLGEQPF